MKPTLVSSRTISEINSMIRNSKIIKERYKISLYINIFFFIILLIGLFVLYKRYKNNINENKNETIKQFYNNVNKLYQQNTEQSPQHSNDNNIITSQHQSPINGNKNLRFDELLPPPINTFNGDIPIQSIPGMHQQQQSTNHNPNYSKTLYSTHYNSSPLQNYNSLENQNYNPSPSQNYNSIGNQNYNPSPSQKYNSIGNQNYNPSPATQKNNSSLHNYQTNYNPSPNLDTGIHDLNDVSSRIVIDNNLPNNSEKWNDMGFMAYNDNNGGYESFI